jgi:hypothetical protein
MPQAPSRLNTGGGISIWLEQHSHRRLYCRRLSEDCDGIGIRISQVQSFGNLVAVSHGTSAAGGSPAMTTAALRFRRSGSIPVLGHQM